MNDVVTFTRLIFEFKDKETLVTLSYDSTNPVLTGRGKQKSFPKSKSALDILKDDVPDYLNW